MAPTNNPNNFDSVMIIIGCITSVILAIKGFFVVCIEILELVPRGIKSMKDAIRSWKERKYEKRD